MNTIPLISIDTIEIEAEGENILLPDTHFSRVVSADGEIIAMSQNRRETKSEFGIHSLRARTKHDGRTLCVEGSPYGHKYGQNVFTSPLLLPACIVALKAVCADCNITPSLVSSGSESTSHSRFRDTTQWRLNTPTYF